MDLSFIFSSLILFLFGVSIGSFLNVLIDRLSTERNIFNDRSECESCKHKLGAKDLIPLVSFLMLRGKCRYCKAKIPTRLPIVEALTGVVFVSLYAYATIFLLPLHYFIFLLIIISCFMVIIFADLIYGLIPDLMVGTLTIVSIVYHLSFNSNNSYQYILSAFISFLFFLLIFIVTKGRGMGFGDVKLSFSLGMLLGFPGTIVAFYVAFLTGAMVSLILILWKKKKFKGDTIPFGPFMIWGAVVGIFLGEIIIRKVSSLWF